uniref:hypothetical protein n=1 Tax=Coprococcus catus TaxID=116085 RepID=UPI0022E0E8E5|nr:hypothetical protein [Coprococcus catus]
MEMKTIDYAKLAVVIINEYESDRAESGRKEIRKRMKYVLDKYKSEHDKEIIDEILMTFTGWNLETLVQKSEKISDDEVEEE